MLVTGIITVVLFLLSHPVFRFVGQRFHRVLYAAPVFDALSSAVAVWAFGSLFGAPIWLAILLAVTFGLYFGYKACEFALNELLRDLRF